MNTRNPDPFGARAVMDTAIGKAYYYRLDSLERAGVGEISESHVWPTWPRYGMLFAMGAVIQPKYNPESRWTW